MALRTGQLDTTIEIVTPENIAFRYDLAGPFRRAFAYAIDVLIRVSVFFVGSFVLMILSSWAGLPGFGVGAALVAWFLLDWFYGGLFETYWNGQTPGKRMMQIRVLSVDGQPINGLQAVLRTFLRIADLQPGILGIVGLVTAMANDRFQRLGDLACGTIVVLEERGWFRGIVYLNEPEVIRLAGEIPVSFQASRTLARALSAYVHRRQYFSLGRRTEIARHVGEPLRERFQLPAGTDLDQLLCALYHRTFVTERPDESRAAGESPFGAEQNPLAGLGAAPEFVSPDEVVMVTDEKGP
jgi:uncharacterized RDD family membrane protein YckC